MCQESKHSLAGIFSSGPYAVRLWTYLKVQPVQGGCFQAPSQGVVQHRPLTSLSPGWPHRVSDDVPKGGRFKTEQGAAAKREAVLFLTHSQK